MQEQMTQTSNSFDEQMAELARHVNTTIEHRAWWMAGKLSDYEFCQRALDQQDRGIANEIRLRQEALIWEEWLA